MLIPSTGTASVLENVKNLFSGISPLVLLLLSVIFGFFILEFLIDLFTSRAASQKQETDLLPRVIESDIKELKFLAKRFKIDLPRGWEKEVKEAILRERLNKLLNKYNLK